MTGGWDGAGAARGARQQGWWRRNWWGLAAVAPLLVAVVLLSPDGLYQFWQDELAKEDTRPPGPDGWAGNGDARLRMTSFGTAELVDRDGAPFELPGLRAWRATAEVEVTDPAAEPFCRFSLETVAGQRFRPSPNALAPAYQPGGELLETPSCSPPPGEDGEPQPGRFRTTGWFLLPESAEPAAVRAELSDLADYRQETVYLRLEVG